MDSNSPTVCLNMIVKNESKIITRLFDSVLHIIDTFCIYDTGSTDNTIEIIETYFKVKNIIGKVISEPFQNFAHNRNIALHACVGMSDYVLLLDADMVLCLNQFNKNILNTDDDFYICQTNSTIQYINTRIVKNNGQYQYIGVTHEYINKPKHTKELLLDKNTIYIQDIGDGGSKQDKFKRDILLLTNGLKDEPNNSRYYFYLANSYHDLGNYEKAIEIYKKRIQLDGWKEEVWYSYYRIGLCYKKMEQFSNALYYWLEGYDFYPERLEGLYEIIHYYRLNSKYKLCMIFYKIAKEILDQKYNRDRYLFLHNDVYSYNIYYEYTIFAFYNGIRNIDNEFITIFNNINNRKIIDNLLSNMKFYKNILSKKQTITLDDTIVYPMNGENILFYSSSSCLIKNNENNYYMNIRYVNYRIEPDGNYKNCEKNIITLNKFVELDNTFNINKEKEFIMNTLFEEKIYIGVEDIRLYHNNYNDNNNHNKNSNENSFRFIGTGYHTNNQLGLVYGNYNIIDKQLEGNELKQHFCHTTCEKNWVFVEYLNETHIIYDWYPLKICKLINNEFKIITTIEMPGLFSRIRGSSCGTIYHKKININDNGTIKLFISEKEIWFVNHLVSCETPRHYYHIISVFDKNMNLLRYSAPFQFEGTPIEYCLSIVVEDERILMNYSNWDRTTRIGVYDKSYIDALLVFK